MTSKTTTKNNRSKLSALFAAAIIFIIILFTVSFPCPTKTQVFFLRILVGLGGGILAAFISGTIFINYKYAKATGGLGVFVFLVIYTPNLIVNYDKCDKPFNITIYFKKLGDNSNNSIAGIAKLKIDSEIKAKKIDENSSCIFTIIPAEYRNQNVELILEAKGWEFENRTSSLIIQLDSSSKNISIQKDDSQCCISGYVRDKDGNALDSAKITIKGITVLSSQIGWFSISIPMELQENEYYLNASKEGYSPYSVTVYPETKQETIIQMKK